ncbi:MAG: hypothetical protein Q4E53_00940 [Eubacteriales bacterium]|nr:hypothetical protein [Eubacteriales bacterium]
MIHVNLLLPVCGDTLKIPCEENMLTDSLMEKITDMLPEERQHSYGRRSWLCHVDQRRILMHHASLKENGVMEGSNLILI